MQFVALVLVARLLGAVVNRIGHPAVVGELAPGLVLGPTVLFPRDAAQSAMLLAAVCSSPSGAGPGRGGHRCTSI